MGYDLLDVTLSFTDRETIRASLELTLVSDGHAGRAPSLIRDTLNKLRWAENQPRV